MAWARFTVPLWGKSTGHLWTPPPPTWFNNSFVVNLNKLLNTDSQLYGDFTNHDAYAYARFSVILTRALIHLFYWVTRDRSFPHNHFPLVLIWFDWDWACAVSKCQGFLFYWAATPRVTKEIYLRINNAYIPMSSICFRGITLLRKWYIIKLFFIHSWNICQIRMWFKRFKPANWQTITTRYHN